ncbi:COG3650 family protein [Novosphingobium sp. ZW T3_23]|uniref:COG3650 family protein n=1 Tax=Novosphingobium sp. ZW T3_23 TaxID=3378084 RepID=UPI003852B540
MSRIHAAVQRILLAAFVSATVSACHGGAKDMPGDAGDRAPFHDISEHERIRVIGTEPFWNGEVAEGRMTYTTPDEPQVKAFPVDRFAGRGGLSFSGEPQGVPWVLAIAPGDCSDGMSDRAYPFTALLKIGEETRQGCAWTDARRPVERDSSSTESR